MKTYFKILFLCLVGFSHGALAQFVSVPPLFAESPGSGTLRG